MKRQAWILAGVAALALTGCGKKEMSSQLEDYCAEQDASYRRYESHEIGEKDYFREAKNLADKYPNVDAANITCTNGKAEMVQTNSMTDAGPGTSAAISLVVFFGIFAWLLRLTRDKNSTKGAIADRAALEKIASQYPDYKIFENEWLFNRRKKRIYRVNSDGLKVMVEDSGRKLWVVNGDSGEFRRVVKTVSPGEYIVKPETYKQRFVKYHTIHARGKWKIPLGGAFFLSVYLVLLLAGYVHPPAAGSSSGPTPTEYLIALLVFAVPAALIIPISMQDLDKDFGREVGIGPEPLQFRAHDHGPTVGEMPDTGDAVPLDEYRPAT